MGNSAVQGKRPADQAWLKWLNLRPEESGRTFWMFSFYGLASVGSLWLEVSTGALFLERFGAGKLPWIYLGSALISGLVGICYSQVQRFIPLRRVILIAAVVTTLPIFLLLGNIGGGEAGGGEVAGSLWMQGLAIFIARVWFEVITVVNELNTAIAANQLFTIREIKRTYPFISSGILAADVISGLSLPLLRRGLGLPNVMFLGCITLLLSAGILFSITRKYHQFFPQTSRKLSVTKQDSAVQKIRNSHYIRWVIVVFAMVQILAILLDFQYYSQVESNLKVEAASIADFLALFSAILGFVEMSAQWFVSGRILERLGVFLISGIPPGLIFLLSGITLFKGLPIFAGTIALKFTDELLRYTLVASVTPVLFQPLPKASRNQIQSMVRGVAEPIATGATGLLMLAAVWSFNHFKGASLWLNREQFFLTITALFAALWGAALWALHNKYVKVLVMGAEHRQLSQSNVDRAIVCRNLAQALAQAQTETEQETFVDVLLQISPESAGETLSPYLVTFSPRLQRKSLGAMLNHPNPLHLKAIWRLFDSDRPIHPEVFALALRYVWRTEENPSPRLLKRYLQVQTDPVVRGTAAALMLQMDESVDRFQKAEATEVLRRMITHKSERERVMGCRALGETEYLQALRIYVDQLLRDDSLRVRCATLEAIAATRQEAHYPALKRGFTYRSMRAAAKQALLRLQDDGVVLLLELATDPFTTEEVRLEAWKTLAEVGTTTALDTMVNYLPIAWGSDRSNLLKILLKLPDELGVEVVSDLLGRPGIETLIEQELQLIAHLYAGTVDLGLDQLNTDGSSPEVSLSEPLNARHLDSEEMNALRRALTDAAQAACDRLLLLAQFVSDLASELTNVQAAAFNIQLGSAESLARGIEILDYTLQTTSKPLMIAVLDQQPEQEKLAILRSVMDYEPLPARQRLQRLLDLRHFLTPWAIACCFHVARQERWSVQMDAVLASLQHPEGFVQEAVLGYIRVVSPKALPQILPKVLSRLSPEPLLSKLDEIKSSEINSLENRENQPSSTTRPYQPKDPYRLLRAYVKELMAEFCPDLARQRTNKSGYTRPITKFN